MICIRKSVAVTAALCLFCILASADVKLGNGFVVTPEIALGADRPYVVVHQDLTPAPEGYEAFAVEHYGRHGSRFAYAGRFYSDLMKCLIRANELGVLTDFGRDLYSRFGAKFDYYMKNIGNLTDMGWNQHKAIAAEMYSNFPSAFPDGAEVVAVSSTSHRCILSMGSFCLSLQACNPKLQIRERFGKEYLWETFPRNNDNPYRVDAPASAVPDHIDPLEFQRRKVDADKILGRLFKDAGFYNGKQDKDEFVLYLSVLVAGMNSLDAGDRTDFTGLFTEEELAYIWEALNYHTYYVYRPYIFQTYPVAQSIIEDADSRIQNNSCGARLRFGHDHVFMPLLTILGLDGYGIEIPETDNMTAKYRTSDSPKAANIQFVFYRSVKGKKTGDVLVKALLNGKETTLPVKAVTGPYYRWNDYREWLLANIEAIKSVK